MDEREFDIICQYCAFKCLASVGKGVNNYHNDYYELLLYSIPQTADKIGDDNELLITGPGKKDEAVKTVELVWTQTSNKLNS